MTDSMWFRLRRIFRPSPRVEADDEIAFHIESRTRELIEEGVDPATARRRAEERFGPVPPIEEALVRSTSRRREREDRAEALSALKQDVRYAVRALKAQPTFALAAVGTLALGIGAALAVFTVVNGVLLRPMPYKDPSALAMIWMTEPDRQTGARYDAPLASGFYKDIERDASGFLGMAAFRSWPITIANAGTDASEAEPVAGARVTPALFDVLGVRPLRGHGFTSEDGLPGGSPVAVISYDLWQRKFGGDDRVVGSQISLGGTAFTVTGIMPPDFAFPRGAELPAPFQFGARTDVWTPMVFDPNTRNYGVQNLSVVARLKSATRDGARNAENDLASLMQRYLETSGSQMQLSYRVVALRDQAAATVRRTLLVLLGAVAFVLLIAAANVASLQVARVSHRRRELAVRAALGAGRGRIARQLITENLVLAGIATAIGVALSWGATKVLLAMVPGSLPRADDVGLDWRVLAGAAGVALATGLAFGWTATYTVRWSRLSATLHSGDGRTTGGISRRFGRRALVALEVALSLVLLIGAALLTRSFVELSRVRPGFDASQTLTANASIPIAGRFRPDVDGPRSVTTFTEIANRLTQLPGAVSAGAVSTLPLTGGFENGAVHIPGRTVEPGQGRSAQVNVVAGDYFRAAGIRLLAGRAFDASDADSGRTTLIVNEVLAKTLFGSVQDALGRELSLFAPTNPPRVIVGVVDPVKQLSLDEESRPQMYVPISQMGYPAMQLVVRTSGDPLAAVSHLKQAVRAADPGVTLKSVMTFERVVSQSLQRQRFNMTLIGTFALLALVLAIVGLYSVLALLVGQRQREIGVRLALGASPGDVVRMVVGEGARVTAVGVVLGIGGALALTRVMATMLYGVGTTDLLTFAVASAIVVVASLAGAYAPARRAARVDPKAALIAE